MNNIVDYSYRMMYNNVEEWSFLEKRIAKVNISPAGGTAGKNARTCKVTLPTSWVDALGVGDKDREVVLAYDGEKIVLSQKLSGEEFAARNLELKHDVRMFMFYDGDKLCTVIYADFDNKSLTVENHVSNPVKTAFGNNTFPTWQDLQFFFEERCIPRERAGLREYLEVIGVGEYDPLEIIKKTSGRMAEDNQWLKVEVLK